MGPAGSGARRLCALSVALGVLVLAAVPAHAALRAESAVLEHEDYLRPACRVPVEVFPEPICPRVVAGESPVTVALGLIVVPLLAAGLRPRRLLAIAVLSASWAAVQLAGPFLFTFRPTSGERPGPFQAETGCGLVNCGLEHTLFHLGQLPFLAAIAVLSYRAYRERA